jgi:hypothetical protein
MIANSHNTFAHPESVRRVIQSKIAKIHTIISGIQMKNRKKTSQNVQYVFENMLRTLLSNPL